jgi:hypothetical protein
MKPAHALAIASVLALGLVPLGPAVEGKRGEGAGSATTPSPRVMPSAQAGKGPSGYLDCEKRDKCAGDPGTCRHNTCGGCISGANGEGVPAECGAVGEGCCGGGGCCCGTAPDARRRKCDSDCPHPCKKRGDCRPKDCCGCGT